VPAQQVEVSITTQSQKMLTNPLPDAIVPKITMNGTPIPAPAGKSPYPTGWQVVVIDAFKDMTDPASIISNKYVWITLNSGSWGSTYQNMYKGMVRQTLLSGNLQQQLVLIASYGLDNNMPPTNDGLELLMEYGGGAQLQQWELNCNPGSQIGGEKQLVGAPANYILIGRSSDSYGMGNEKFERGDPVTSNLTVTLRNPVPPS
jgi:hypothetical protein